MDRHFAEGKEEPRVIVNLGDKAYKSLPVGEEEDNLSGGTDESLVSSVKSPTVLFPYNIISVNIKKHEPGSSTQLKWQRKKKSKSK